MAGELSRMIRTLRKMPELIKATAPECAQALDAEINAQLAAGRGPSGEAWAPLKKGAGKPLADAPGSATLTRAVGTTLITRAQFPYTFHNAGARGGALPKRTVVPQRLSSNLEKAIAAPLERAFERSIRG